MDIETLARAHWWHRARQTTHAKQALQVCLGATNPQAQCAADEINQAWDKVKDSETEAMRSALSGMTLAAIMGDNTSPAHTRTPSDI